MIIPVILSGGSGTRLWPLSRASYPKQLLSLIGDHSMIQDTVLRLQQYPDIAAPVIVCNDAQRFHVAEQMQAIGINDAAIVLEPVARNTAPAIALAALEVQELAKDALMLVLPADHVIRDQDAFYQAIDKAAERAQQGSLMTFGVVPDRPETGYGYIQGDAEGKISRFLEKPDQATAESLLAAGDYFWNSGMFLFTANAYLQELGRFNPAMLTACQDAWKGSSRDLDFIRINTEAFSASPSDSIDYAVMEHTADAGVVPLDAGWNDVGSWQSLLEIGEGDADGNVIHGDVLTYESKNNLIHAGSRMVSTIGLQDHVVVETADAVLVAPAERSQDVKKIVEQLKAQGRDETDNHQQVFRPWGSYQTIDMSERFQVKRISVKPGRKLSLQMHHHRAEHWIVVNGTAEITCGEEVSLLSENQSTYIPLGVKHRLANPGTIPLELIEVQSGTYLGEDDIVRFEDLYGRVESKT